MLSTGLQFLMVACLANNLSAFVPAKILSPMSICHALKRWDIDEIAIIPIPQEQILLPGQSRYLHFYEDRLLKLGEYSQKNGGLVALGFYDETDETMLTVCTLCQM
jgi:hypothetical protein